MRSAKFAGFRLEIPVNQVIYCGQVGPAPFDAEGAYARVVKVLTDSDLR